MSVFADLPRIIQPADLVQRLDAPELILVDLSPAEDYLAGHIAHARWVDSKRTQRAGEPVPGLAPELSQLNALFSEIGHRDDATYVVYDNEGGGWAGRFAWLLDVIGHDNWHYVDGGRQAWIADQLPLSKENSNIEPTPVQLSINTEPTATREYVQQRLGADDVAIWDARSPAEYRGEKLLAQRGGHIPHAVNLEWTSAMDPARGLRLRQDLTSVLAELGITADKEIITHCQTHRRSGLTYLIARAMGFPRVKAYAGSWSEWGNTPDAPIEL